MYPEITSETAEFIVQHLAADGIEVIALDSIGTVLVDGDYAFMTTLADGARVTVTFAVDDPLIIEVASIETKGRSATAFEWANERDDKDYNPLDVLDSDAQRALLAKLKTAAFKRVN